VVSNLTVPNNAYGAGWNGSTNVPNENSVYDEMELRAPKASPAFTTSATIGGTNILDYAASHLTEAEASALYQRTNAVLTATVAGTAVSVAQTNAVSFGAPTLYVGTTNVAVAVAAKAPIAGPSFTGTATNTGSFGAPTLYVGSTNVAAAIALKANIAGPSFTGYRKFWGSYALCWGDKRSGCYCAQGFAGPSFTGAATNTGSFGAPTLYVGSTNVAVALAASSSDTNWNGNPIASGTITNLTVTSINQSTYYDVENGDSWSDGLYTTSTTTFFPYITSLLNSGTVGNDWPTTNNPGIWSIKSSASSDSGGQFITSGNAIILSGFGHEHTTICTINQTNSVVGYFGFQDGIFSSSLPTDGVFLLLSSGYISGVAVNNGSVTYSATSNTIAPSDTTTYRMVATVDTNGIAQFQARKVLGVNSYSNVWSGSITSTIAPWPTGFGVTAFRTSGSNNLTLITVDALGQRNLRKYAR
jgi:hypothetical protein